MICCLGMLTNYNLYERLDKKRLDELNIELRINEEDKELLGDEVEESSKDKVVEKEFEIFEL